MKTGKVKLVDKTRGFGFITRDDDGKDIYFSLADVTRGQQLERGDKVAFEVQKTPEGMKAIKVTKEK